MPMEHVFDQRVIYFTLSFKHFEHFLPEKFFKLVRFGGRTDHESAVVVKASIGGQNMQMGMEISLLPASDGKTGRNACSYMKTAANIHARNHYILPWQSRNVNRHSPNIDKSLLSHKNAKTHIDLRSGHPTALQVVRNEIQHSENNDLPAVSGVYRHQIQYWYSFLVHK